MSKTITAHNRGAVSRHLNGGGSLLVSRAPINDGGGAWSFEQLMDMNDRFVAALERAIALGLERRESAARQYRVGAGERRASGRSAPAVAGAGALCAPAARG